MKLNGKEMTRSCLNGVDISGYALNGNRLWSSIEDELQVYTATCNESSWVTTASLHDTSWVEKVNAIGTLHVEPGDSDVSNSGKLYNLSSAAMTLYEYVEVTVMRSVYAGYGTANVSLAGITISKGYGEVTLQVPTLSIPTLYQYVGTESSSFTSGSAVRVVSMKLTTPRKPKLNRSYWIFDKYVLTSGGYPKTLSLGATAAGGADTGTLPRIDADNYEDYYGHHTVYGKTETVSTKGYKYITFTFAGGVVYGSYTSMPTDPYQMWVYASDGTQLFHTAASGTYTADISSADDIYIVLYAADFGSEQIIHARIDELYFHN